MCPTCSGSGMNDASGETNLSVHRHTPKLPPDTIMVSLDQLRLSQRQTAQFERENERLTSQLKEVIGMNTRWQKYDEQREAHVLRLHDANKELLSKLASVQKVCSELQAQILGEKLREERPDISGAASRLKDSKKVEQTSNTAPMCALDARFARKEKEVATLSDEVERFKEEIASLRRTETNRRKDEEERITIFKAQLEVCMEDFRQERGDREKMHAERLRLRKQLDEAEITIARLHEEINDLIEETRWLRDRPSRLTHHYGDLSAASSRPTLHYNYYTTSPSKPNNYIKKVVVPGVRVGGMDFPDYDSVSDLPSDVTVDGEGPLSDPVPALGLLSVNDGGEGVASPTPLSVEGGRLEGCVRAPGGVKPETPLRCPQCLIEFAVEEHGKMLKHIEMCSGDK